ncbi:MAG: T9SS type A sorting domain-containing protein [Candidatus Marinimicrobia bacterium]|nr:T9SS type A sorting domain-containing protein [Candidatus Neomarinimicrobiota bacterium]
MLNFPRSQENIYFIPGLINTGVNHLAVLANSVTGISLGDEIGIFDENGLMNFNNCDNEFGMLLVGAGVYNGNQLAITSVGSVDNCQLDGIQIPGYVDENKILARIWNAFTNTEYPVHLLIGTGEGVFGELFTVIEDIQYFTPPWSEYDSETSMTIQVMSAEIQGFLPDVGDEIAVFDGDICVGSLKYSLGWESELTFMAGQGTTDIDGFIAGHSMSFKIWDATDAFEENLFSLELSGDQVFTAGGFTQISIIGLSAEIHPVYPTEFSILNTYPTPFNSRVKVEYGISQITNLKIQVYDILGKKILTLFDSVKPAGYHTVSWAPHQISSGVYYIHFQTEFTTKSIPVVYLK